MNLQLPSLDEIQVAFKQGEADVVALFDKVSLQIVELAEQMAKQAEVIKELQAKAAKNSRNSAKPPSSDTTRMPPQKIKRGKPKKRAT